VVRRSRHGRQAIPQDNGTRIPLRTARLALVFRLALL
jgi:hypothetical protein